MRQILILLIINCCFGFSLKGQLVEDCIKKDTIEKNIIILANNIEYAAHINFDLCFDKNNFIYITIGCDFSTRGVDLNEKRAERQGHELKLLEIIHDAHDLFIPVLKPDGARVITEPFNIVYVPVEEAGWVDKRIEFILNFSYNIERQGGLTKTEEVSFSFQIPDKILIEEPSVDTVKEIDNMINTVPSEIISETVDNKMVENIYIPGSIDTIINITDCIDSISFYFKRMGNLYNLVEEKGYIDRMEVESLIESYRSDSVKIANFFKECDNPKSQSYKRDYKRISDYISSHFANIVVEDTKVAPRKAGSKKTEVADDAPKMLHINMIYVYILFALAAILILVYIFTNIKKKHK
ncbi:MAG: hypothetical protein HQ541_10330 [Mariniphaga sp.]|nr:hypothetical protein [Mariniphaga sp.]